jgi:hypothetical protein
MTAKALRRTLGKLKPMVNQYLVKMGCPDHAAARDEKNKP